MAGVSQVGSTGTDTAVAGFGCEGLGGLCRTRCDGWTREACFIAISVAEDSYYTHTPWMHPTAVAG